LHEKDLTSYHEYQVKRVAKARYRTKEKRKESFLNHQGDACRKNFSGNLGEERTVTTTIS